MRLNLNFKKYLYIEQKQTFYCRVYIPSRVDIDFHKLMMQRIISMAKTVMGMQIPRRNFDILTAKFSIFQKSTERILPTFVPTINPVCGFKVKGRVRRRCNSCYFVCRQERVYVICPKHPRHKQMAMKAKPLNTYILTHASQCKVRPW